MCEPNARRALEGSASAFYVPGKLQVRLKVRILRRLVAVFRLRPGCLGGVINISELVGGCGHTYGRIAVQMMQSLRSHRPMQFP